MDSWESPTGSTGCPVESLLPWPLFQQLKRYPRQYLFLLKWRSEKLKWRFLRRNVGNINSEFRDSPACPWILHSKACTSCSKARPEALLKWQEASALSFSGLAGSSWWEGLVQNLPTDRHHLSGLQWYQELPGLGWSNWKEGYDPPLLLGRRNHCSCHGSPASRRGLPAAHALRLSTVPRFSARLEHKWSATLEALSLQFKKRQNAFGPRDGRTVLNFAISSCGLEHGIGFQAKPWKEHCISYKRFTFSR